MITRFTGVSQAGRLCFAAEAPSSDPSAEVLASVPLTAGLSLNLLLVMGHKDRPAGVPRCPALTDLAGEAAMPGPSGSYRPGRANRPGVNQSSLPCAAEITLTPRRSALPTGPGRTRCGTVF